MKKRLAIIAAIIILLLLAFSVYRAVHKKATFKPPESIAAIQKELGVPVSLSKYTVTNMVDYLHFKASVEPIERAVVMSRLSARVQRINVEEGDSVQGPPNATVLVELDNRDLLIRHQAATSSLHEAKANYDRAESLLAAGGLSRQELERATVRLDLARAETVRAETDLADSTISSPITGRVFRRFVEPGNVAAPGARLLEIVDTSRLKICFNIPEKDIPGVATGKTCLIHLDAYPDASPLAAKVDVLIPALNPDTRQLEGISHMERDERLLPGMHARVDVEREHKTNVKVIPADALVRVRGLDGVYLAREKNGAFYAHFTPLALGMRTDGLVEVQEGLAQGDMFVANGQHQLTDGAPIRPVSETDSIQTPPAQAAAE